MRKIVVMLAAAAALLAPAACSKKQEEPPSRPEAYEPNPLPIEDAGREDARVMRMWRTKLTKESCDTAAKHANIVFGRGETDPMGSILLSRCLMAGNLAWFDCVMAADEPKKISACSRRFFEHPPRQD